jgi:aminomethyltransferase
MFAYDLSNTFGRVRLRGETRIDFLHRMSSGEVRNLRPGQGATTVLTTPNARMIDYVVALPFVDSVLLLTGGGNSTKVAAWLRKYVFFNDDVQVTDESDEQLMLGIFGDGAADFIFNAAGHAADHLVSKPVYSLAATQDVVVIKAPSMAGAGYYLIRMKPSADNGNAHALSTPLAHISYDDLRIAHGYPRFPNEIGEDYIPLEAGLTDAVSFSKGCYIGQEIIARMDSRGQIAKRLVKLEASVGVFEHGDNIYTEDLQPIGKVTSAQSDVFEGRRFALGYVRTPHAVAGERVVIGINRVAASVVSVNGEMETVPAKRA